MTLADAWFFLQQGVLFGLVTGSVYAILALAIVLIFKTTDVPNFAQGEIFMAGGYVALYMVIVLSAGLGVAIAVSLLAVMVACALFQRVVFGQIARSNGVSIHFVIATLGFSYALKGMVHLSGLGDTPRSMPTVIPSGSISIGQAYITTLDATIFCAAVVVMAVLFFIVHMTRLGRALRAVGMNVRGAQLVGISPPRMHLYVWVLSGLISAVAAILISPKLLMTPNMGSMVMLAFAAAIIGGLNSLPGAVIGGFVVGIAENLVGLFISTNAIVVAPFVAIMVTLLIRPQGLFGGKIQVKKV